MGLAPGSITYTRCMITITYRLPQLEEGHFAEGGDSVGGIQMS